MNNITHFHSTYNTMSIYTQHNSRSACHTEHIAIKGSRAPPGCTNKKAASGRPPGHGIAKPTTLKSKSVLPFHHTTPACAAQAEKGSSQNQYFI